LGLAEREAEPACLDVCVHDLGSLLLDARVSRTATRLKSVQKKEVTFLKKSNQKTFAPAGLCDEAAIARRSKSLFASFSSEKEVLASFLNQIHPVLFHGRYDERRAILDARRPARRDGLRFGQCLDPRHQLLDQGVGGGLAHRHGDRDRRATLARGPVPAPIKASTAWSMSASRMMIM
jgi:hypothetical protein